MILIQVKKVKKEKEAQKIIKKVNNNKAAKKENHCFYLNQMEQDKLINKINSKREKVNWEIN